jgi:hypothetical protein
MWWLYNLVSVMVFCLSSRQFLKSLTEGLRWERRERYSLKALRVERNYRRFAWGLMTFIWIYLCVLSFVHSFQQNDL